MEQDRADGLRRMETERALTSVQNAEKKRLGRLEVAVRRAKEVAVAQTKARVEAEAQVAHL